MPRIFWTVNKKNKLAILSKSMTIPELSRHYKRPEEEIIRVLSIVRPAAVMIEAQYEVCGIRITKYRAAYAAGVEPQQMGKNRELF